MNNILFQNDQPPALTRERARQLAIDAFVSACERETNTGDSVSTNFSNIFGWNIILGNNYDSRQRRHSQRDHSSSPRLKSSLLAEYCNFLIKQQLHVKTRKPFYSHVRFISFPTQYMKFCLSYFFGLDFFPRELQVYSYLRLTPSASNPKHFP